RSQKHVNGLVADTLLFFALEIYGKDDFTFPVSREEIGNLIGTTKETVSRVLNEFDKDGLISMKGKQVKILDRGKLKTISQKG
ncbi:MAG TPA: helix-turn-helix domain-containing protein, partial [Bacteroidales bacterium]|nr:helix-turn-helix domain-containing protein [Bacteroidales bacterium]